MPVGRMYFIRGEFKSHYDLFGNAPIFGANHRPNQKKRRRLERQTGRKRK